MESRVEGRGGEERGERSKEEEKRSVKVRGSCEAGETTTLMAACQKEHWYR